MLWPNASPQQYFRPLYPDIEMIQQILHLVLMLTFGITSMQLGMFDTELSGTTKCALGMFMGAVVMISRNSYQSVGVFLCISALMTSITVQAQIVR
jgi:hypothetical protein